MFQELVETSIQIGVCTADNNHTHLTDDSTFKEYYRKIRKLKIKELFILKLYWS